MKKLILASACAFAIFSAVAGNNYLHVRTSSGWEVLDLDKVDKLSFAGENMVASDADGNTVSSYIRSELQTMHVNDDPAGVNSVISDNKTSATFSFNATSGTATMIADGNFEIFDLSGATLVSIPEVKQGETVALTGIKPGAVILKSGNYSIKVIIK